MIEDTKLKQYCLKPISDDKIVSSHAGERAFGIQEISHGTCLTREEEEKKFAAIRTVRPNTFCFELETTCDFVPFELATYTADKVDNAVYTFGEHAPGEKRYKEKCRFKPGDKVLALIFEGYNAVFPGIVVGPLTEEYLRQYYNSTSCEDVRCVSEDKFVEKWIDWNWDSILIRPLVRLKNDWEEMGEIVIVNRVYVFPYKKLEI